MSVAQPLPLLNRVPVPRLPAITLVPQQLLHRKRLRAVPSLEHHHCDSAACCDAKGEREVDRTCDAEARRVHENPCGHDAARVGGDEGHRDGSRTTVMRLDVISVPGAQTGWNGVDADYLQEEGCVVGVFVRRP